MTEAVYLYDGSWEGLLTAVFDAFATKRWPEQVLEEECAQLGFGQEAVRIEADAEKAGRVERGIVRHLGSPAYNNVWTAFLSGSPEKSTVIYRYVRAGLSKGRMIYSALAHKDVLAIDNLNRHTLGEAHLLRGFVRFSLMENGVYYGRITPKNNVLPLLMPFFCDRYGDQPLLLYDSVHQIAGVHDLRDWYLVETDGLDLPALAEEEVELRRMWKRFYEAIAVKERQNHKCRRGHMPKRYWENLTEFGYERDRYR